MFYGRYTFNDKTNTRKQGTIYFNTSKIKLSILNVFTMGIMYAYASVLLLTDKSLYKARKHFSKSMAPR